MKNKYQVKDGVTVKLKKKIPISAGLGGGSSNAASTITALNELWELNLTEQEQHEIAGLFGSDINFFLQGGTALGEGRGEKINALDSIELDNILLVNPGIGIASREAYLAVTIPDCENENWKLLLETGNVKYCYNALEEGVCQNYPVIGETLTFLRENGAKKAMLSGSGATMIGFCPDLQTAENLAEYFSDQKYWNCITKTIKRSTK